MTSDRLTTRLHERFSGRASFYTDTEGSCVRVRCASADLPDVCGALFNDLDCAFVALIPEENEDAWCLRYVFHTQGTTIHVTAETPLDRTLIPSISARVHAADWHERAAEDLFGFTFSGHPRLGEFVLHEQWPERTNPMRLGFDGRTAFPDSEPDPHWDPPSVLTAPGAFSMPVGPIHSAAAEPVHFQLETIGEEIVRAIPRLFYKYRAVEKLAQDRSVGETLLLAERFSGTSSFAHALSFCRAVERIAGADVPPRAQRLRVFLAELERLRHHIAAIHGICASTGLVVAASQAAILEEEVLRVSGGLAGHRYLFGLAVPGGLGRDLSDAACRNASASAQDVLQRLNRLDGLLTHASSFLDRLEQVGIVASEAARAHGLVGPVARASGVARDLRTALPYSGYEAFPLAVAQEEEGDGYARLRVLFAEARESTRLLSQIAADLPTGAVQGRVVMHAGSALGWAEAPCGAAFHWVRVTSEGTVASWRVAPPSFANWHGVHLAIEGYAFQDFPIILATFSLSVAENDR
jgi:formate hydrogenlyase subunit 5